MCMYVYIHEYMCVFISMPTVSVRPHCVHREKQNTNQVLKSVSFFFSVQRNALGILVGKRDGKRSHS
jgi:hypothetical protein